MGESPREQIPHYRKGNLGQADYYFGQAVPILAWGKMKKGEIPFSCKFHHGFMDGPHVGRFFADIENSFANPDSLWEGDTPSGRT